MTASTVAAPWRQLPEGIHPLIDWSAFWNWADNVSDERVRHWPLMGSIWPTIGVCIAYVLFIVFGKMIMKNRPAMDLTHCMTAYNIFVIGLNGWLFYGLIRTIVEQKYNAVCNPVDYGPEGTDVAWLIYVYYLSKILDLSDTVFMILRKKFDQATFLHVYHHGMMVLIWWTAVKWAAGGNAIVGPLMNTFIHFVMYSYYLAATYKIHIPGKKHLTRMQMAQLFILMQHSILTVAVDCPYPHWTMYAQIGFMVTLLILFGNFYYHAYRKGRSARASRAAAASAEAAKNIARSSSGAASGSSSTSAVRRRDD